MSGAFDPLRNTGDGAFTFANSSISEAKEKRTASQSRRQTIEPTLSGGGIGSL